MNKKVIDTQNISSMCLICGKDNVLGMHMHFYELEGGVLAAKFTGRDEHQSYPGRMHGGMICAILDEMVGRLLKLGGRDDWGVTGEIQVRYRKPVPLGVELLTTARIEKENKLLMIGSADILLPDGTVAAHGTAKYMKFTAGEITSDAAIADYWLKEGEEAPEYIDVPEI